MEIDALAGFMLNAPSSVKFTPLPAPHCKQAAPLAVLSEPPPEPAASKYDETNLVVAVIVVPVIVFGVVPPMIGGADKSSEPPKVKFPVLVTVPDKLIPDTVPVPLTDVTVPTVGVAQVGTPAANVNTWPFAPTARKEVAPAPVWYGTEPNAPPPKFVAVVAVVAVPALPEIEPVIVLVTVKSNKVPRPVIPV
jgi:hypothetical protein